MLGKRNPQNNPPQAGKPEEFNNSLVSEGESVTSKEVDCYTDDPPKFSELLNEISQELKRLGTT